MTNSQSMLASLAPLDRPICPKCGAPMFLTSIEPDMPNHGLSTFECPNCRHVEGDVVKFW